MSAAGQDAGLQECLLRLRSEGVTPGLSLSGPRQGEVLEQALTLHITEKGLGGKPTVFSRLRPANFEC